MEESIQFAKKYLEDLLSFFGLNTDVYATTEDNEVIELNIPSTQLNGFLIGQHGDTMRALQYIVSNALRSKEFEFTRINVDVADYKKQRADRLSEKAEAWVKKVQESGESMHLQPMNAADRRTIHRFATDYGVETASEGEGRERHIVLTSTKDSKTDKSGDAEEVSESKEVEEPKDTQAKEDKPAKNPITKEEKQPKKPKE